MNSTHESATLELSAGAMAYLKLLGELGHLSAAQRVRFLESLPGQSAPMTRGQLRELLAVYLFCAHDQMSPEQRELLEGEWPLLFG